MGNDPHPEVTGSLGAVRLRHGPSSRVQLRRWGMLACVAALTSCGSTPGGTQAPPAARPSPSPAISLPILVHTPEPGSYTLTRSGSNPGTVVETVVVKGDTITISTQGHAGSAEVSLQVVGNDLREVASAAELGGTGAMLSCAPDGVAETPLSLSASDQWTWDRQCTGQVATGSVAVAWTVTGHVDGVARISIGGMPVDVVKTVSTDVEVVSGIDPNALTISTTTVRYIDPRTGLVLLSNVDESAAGGLVRHSTLMFNSLPG